MKYIINVHNIYLTRDNWKTYEAKGIDYKIPEEFSEEEDQNKKNIMCEIRLRNKYGNLGLVIINEFKYINELIFQNDKAFKKNDGYGSAYEIFSLAVLKHLPYTTILNKYIVKGSQDGKIDGIFYENDTFDLYQIKLGEMKAGAFNQFVNNCNSLIDNNVNLISDAQDLIAKIEKLNVDWDKPKSLNIHLISNEKTDNEGEIAEFINNDDIFKLFIKQRITPCSTNYLELNILKKKIKYSEHNNSYFMFYPIIKLIEEIKKVTCDQDSIFDALFMDNVRRKIKGSENKFKNILKTAEGKVNFHLYNNGISICGEVVMKDTGFTIKNPMIINGQQTLRSLALIYKQDIKRRKKLLNDNVYVPLFIKNIKTTEDQLRFNVAKFNNTQSAIQQNDFISIDENARKIQDEILKKSSFEIFLNLVSSGESSENKYAQECFGDNVVSISDFLRLMLTIEEPEKMGSYKNKKNYSYDNISKDKIKKYADLIPECLKICQSIIIYNKTIKDHNFEKKYLACNLLIQYGLYKNKNIDLCLNYVDKIDEYINNSFSDSGKDIVKYMTSNNFTEKLDFDKFEKFDKFNNE